MVGDGAMACGADADCCYPLICIAERFSASLCEKSDCYGGGYGCRKGFAK